MVTYVQAIAATIVLGALSTAVRAAAPAASAAQTKASADETDASTATAVLFPHIHIDRKKRVVEVEALVVFDPDKKEILPGSEDDSVPRRGGWLELVASTPRMREHESLVAVKARPSHLHQALLMIGLVPGAPRTVIERDDVVEIIPPHGPAVEVRFRVVRKGKTMQLPVGAWVVDRRTGAALKEDRWLFAGSTFHRLDAKEIYLADLNGTVVSLVQFGDDLLCRSTPLTNHDDGQVFAANLDAVPPPGTPVTLCLRAVPPPAAGATSRPAPASQPAKSK